VVELVDMVEDTQVAEFKMVIMSEMAAEQAAAADNLVEQPLLKPQH
jgi:hypothetical protein